MGDKVQICKFYISQIFIVCLNVRQVNVVSLLWMIQIEVEEALDKVTVTSNIFKLFRKAFRHHKSRMPDYIAAALERDTEKEQKPKLWEFQDSLVFERFDSFVGRLNTVKEFFNKL